MQRIVAGFDRTFAFICGALVVALLAVVSLGALTRSLGEPLIWSDELSRFLMVWLAVFGWTVATRKRIHVRIRFFQDLLPARAHQTAELGIQFAMALFGVLVTVYSVGLIGKNYDLDATSLPISMAWMYAPMVLGGAITALQGTSEVIQALRRPPPSPPAAIEEAALE
jgi:TRAP-type C4-dicarboxylate transport system permease small subunit